MVIENLVTGDIYWVSKGDALLNRPIDLIGWIENDIFVFGLCGNPSLCFVTAINPKKKEFLLTLELQDFPQ